METAAHDPSSSRPDSAAADAAVRAAGSRLTAGLRSPWWFHALRGLSVGALVVGIAPRAEWGSASAFLGLAAVVGIIGVVLLARMRTAATGFSGANPDRWRFLATGAPWSVIAILAAVAGMAVAVLDRQLPFLAMLGIGAAAALVVALVGPLADRAARLRLAAGIA